MALSLRLVVYVTSRETAGAMLRDSLLTWPYLHELKGRDAGKKNKNSEKIPTLNQRAG
jgi:hypothetical protein